MMAEFEYVLRAERKYNSDGEKMFGSALQTSIFWLQILKSFVQTQYIEEGCIQFFI